MCLCVCVHARVHACVFLVGRKEAEEADAVCVVCPSRPAGAEYSRGLPCSHLCGLPLPPGNWRLAEGVSVLRGPGADISRQNAGLKCKIPLNPSFCVSLGIPRNLLMGFLTSASLLFFRFP